MQIEENFSFKVELVELTKLQKEIQFNVTILSDQKQKKDFYFH